MFQQLPALIEYKIQTNDGLGGRDSPKYGTGYFCMTLLHDIYLLNIQTKHNKYTADKNPAKLSNRSSVCSP